MPPKEKKTAAELAAIVMLEIRKRQDWNHIHGVAVAPKVQLASHHPNWDAQLTMGDNRARPADAVHLVARLQNQFELA